jgi:hypothetical protein
MAIEMTFVEHDWWENEAEAEQYSDHVWEQRMLHRGDLRPLRLGGQEWQP